MAQPLEFYSGQIEALIRAMAVAKIIREDRDPCMIEEGLYLGSFGAANNKDALKSLNLTHILTIARDINPPYPNEFVYKVLAVQDSVDVNISNYFEECFDYIEEAKGQGGGVLVHCFAGKSRSATIVIAYLMKKHGLEFWDCLNMSYLLRFMFNEVSSGADAFNILPNILYCLQFSCSKVTVERTRVTTSRVSSVLMVDAL